MADFNIRSDSVNVEQIMQQIRARVREKRGVDYTEQQIRELAAVKLERFLDPTKVRSELLQQFHQGAVPPLPDYGFEDTTLFESHRPVLGWIRRLLRPLLMLFMNPNRLIHSLHTQVKINRAHAEYTNLSYEMLHNLVLEVTRLGIDVKNVKMRMESLSSRLDFSERRARALESVVQYRPGEISEEQPAAAAQPGGAREARGEGDQATASEQRRRRRRRRGRRGGTGRPGGGEEGGQEAAGASHGADESDADDRGAAEEREGAPPDVREAGGTGELPRPAMTSTSADTRTPGGRADSDPESQ